MATNRKYEVHHNPDGTIHVTSKYRTAAWAHACFGPKGFTKWSRDLDPAALAAGKPCKCGAQPGTFRKASGQTYLEPKFREKVQAPLFEEPAKPEPAAEKPAKKAAKKKPSKKKAAKKPAEKAAKPSGSKIGALARAIQAKQK